MVTVTLLYKRVPPALPASRSSYGRTGMVLVLQGRCGSLLAQAMVPSAAGHTKYIALLTNGGDFLPSWPRVLSRRYLWEPSLKSPDKIRYHFVRVYPLYAGSPRVPCRGRPPCQLSSQGENRHNQCNANGLIETPVPLGPRQPAGGLYHGCSPRR